MKIVALDFETANASLASACSLGIAVYNDGELEEPFEWLIKPHSRYSFFTNTHIHGLTYEDVKDADEFLYYHDRLGEILDGAIIAAHNARFDLGVLNAVCDLYGLEHFTNPYIDTVAVARRVYPELYNHRLNTLADYLDISLNHHNACSDAYACLMILLKSMEAYQTYEAEEFLEKIHMRLKNNA